MLARIRERVPEIGLRRSLGASRADIAGLCVIEALLTSIGAAVVGIVPRSSCWPRWTPNACRCP